MKYETGLLFALTVLMGVIGFLADRQGFSNQPGWISVISILVFAMPALWAFVHHSGWRKGLLVLVCLSIFALAIESVGVATGFPYGQFYYSADLGWRVFGLVPWTVPFAWIPLLLAAAGLASRVTARPVLRMLATALILVLMDLILDPAAVHAGLWRYSAGGWYFGVPWTNFAGWMFSGVLGAAILAWFKTDDLPVRGVITSACLMLGFWSGVLLHAALTI